MEGLREAMGAPLPPIDRAEYDRLFAALRTTLGEAGEERFDRDSGLLGKGPPFDAAFASSGVFHLLGKGPPFDAAFASSGVFHQRRGPGPRFAAVWAEGRAMSLEDAIRYALDACDAGRSIQV
jgi:hypothetical protein